MLKLVSIKKSTRNDKRLMAEFSNGHITHFGMKGGSTYIDHKNDMRKDAYIARHRINENWNDPFSAGALSRYILWNKPNYKESVLDYKKRFNL